MGSRRARLRRMTRPFIMNPRRQAVKRLDRRHPGFRMRPWHGKAGWRVPLSPASLDLADDDLVVRGVVGLGAAEDDDPVAGGDHPAGLAPFLDDGPAVVPIGHV